VSYIAAVVVYRGTKKRNRWNILHIVGSIPLLPLRRSDP
jgi:hypothetical protein